MEKLKGLISSEAVVVRDGKEQKILAVDLVPGDIVIVEEGDNIPADLRVIQTSDLKINESALTGESLPVEKVCDALEPGEESTCNTIFMETDVSTGRGRGVVVEIGMNTEIGKIAEMIQEEEEETPLHQKIGRLGRNLGNSSTGSVFYRICAGVLTGNSYCRYIPYCNFISSCICSRRTSSNFNINTCTWNAENG